MTRFRHILFPVDFSEQSKAVRPFVKLFARQYDAEVTLLHVLHVPPGWYGGIEGAFPVMFDFSTMEREVQDLMSAFLDNGDIPNVHKVVVQGDPAIQIVEYAREHKIDLIMMPTHGYGGFRGLLLGSVAAKVLHDADCPVWTAPHADAPEMTEHLECETILAAIDTTPDQTCVLKQAAELAKEFAASMRVVHAVPGATRHPLETGGEEFSQYLLQTTREQIDKLQKTAFTDAPAFIQPGAVGTVVHDVAKETGADLVVIGRGVLHEKFGRLRTKSYEIIRDAACPVLSL